MTGAGEPAGSSSPSMAIAEGATGAIDVAALAADVTTRAIAASIDRDVAVPPTMRCSLRGRSRAERRGFQWWP